MVGRLRRAVLASWLALGAALGPAYARAAGAEGGTADELAAARTLFAEALKDEEAKRFADALDKFQRVRAVRDTPQVEYRIGSCYEGLGQPASAYASYSRATALGQDDAKSADVVAAAVDRVNALAKHLGWLSVTLPARVAPDAQVRLDDVEVPLAKLRDPIVLEPGPHVVTATAGDAAPYRSSIVLPEGAHVALTVSLEPAHSQVPPVAPPAATPKGEVRLRREPVLAESSDAGRRTAGWIMVGSGAALLLGAGTMALLQISDLSIINGKCTDDQCGFSKTSPNGMSTDSTRSRAVLEGTLALGLGAGGLVAAAAGAYLVFSSKGSPSAARAARLCIAPVVTADVGAIGVLGEFR